MNASESLRPPLSIAALPLLGVLAAQVLILVLAAWFYGERVRRQALAPGVDDVDLIDTLMHPTLSGRSL